MSDDNDSRLAIVNTLIKLKNNGYKNISLLTVDSKTFSQAQDFERQFRNDFFNFGIAEQHVINVAAGMASCGTCAVIIGIGSFVTMRCFEQIRTVVAHNNYNVKLIGLCTGLCFTNQGHCHTLIEDVAIMRILPNITIYSPSDYVETEAVVCDAINNPGFSYIRIDNPWLSKNHHDESFVFKRGIGEIIRKGDDVTLITTGNAVYEAIETARLLGQKEISCRVVNMSTLKPIDEKIIIEAALQTKVIVTVEEHRIPGGLGSIVAEILCQCTINKHVLFKMIGVEGNCFHENLSYERAKKQSGITALNIAESVETLYKNSLSQNQD
jgi:transketolase